MRISQLAAATEIPVATIKYYLREKLLHEGVLTSATQARYDDSHVRRLKLIRALIGTAGLSISATRQVLLGLENPPESGHDLLGIAHHAVTRTAPDDVDLSPAQQLLDRWGWGAETCDRDTQAALVEALHGLSDAGFDAPAGALGPLRRGNAGHRGGRRRKCPHGFGRGRHEARGSWDAPDGTGTPGHAPACPAKRILPAVWRDGVSRQSGTE